MRRDRHPFAGLLLLLTLQAPAAAAWAQPPPSAQPPSSAQPPPPAQPSDPSAQPPPSGQQPGAVEPKTADEYALEGRKLAMESGKLMDARALLVTAWSMKKSYDIAGNLGSIEFELGMMRDAAEHLFFCQQNFPAVRDADQTEKLARVEALLLQARAQVGSLQLRVTDADGVELEGAEVLVDDKLLGRAPFPTEVFLDPGSRVIVAKQPGHQDASKPIQVVKGGTEGLTLVLPSLTPKPDKQRPIASVVPPKKRVALVAAGAGLAVAGIGLGLGFHMASNGKSDEARDQFDALLKTPQGAGACVGTANAASCEAYRSAFDGRELFRGVSIGGYIAGGLFAAGTVAYVLLPTSLLPRVLLQEGEPATKGVRASVSVTPGGGGAVIEGTF